VGGAGVSVGRMKTSVGVGWFGSRVGVWKSWLLAN
jgi:hypothetical protein